jgi:hypothetical protein
MQNEKVIDRLSNPPVIENKKPIDLGDMPEDMDLELVKVAIFGIVESVLISYQDNDIHKNTVRHNIANEIWKMVVNEGFSKDLLKSEPTTADKHNDKWLKELKEEKVGRSSDNNKDK